MKTDWKDAIFSGPSRKWKITDNDDGTKSIEDVTEYTQQGDSFGAKELNAIGEEVNRISDTVEITLSASGWTGNSAPYIQTVTVEGITEKDNPILVSALSDGADLATQKAYIKAFGIVSSGTGTTGSGTVTFKVYKKPATDIKIGLKGV